MWRIGGELVLTSETYRHPSCWAEAERFARLHGLAVSQHGHGPYGHGTVLYLWRRDRGRA